MFWRILYCGLFANFYWNIIDLLLKVIGQYFIITFFRRVEVCFFLGHVICDHETIVNNRNR
jgi:hypothetical protein